MFKRAVLGGAWQNLNFDKEYLFGFETLLFATSGVLSVQEQLVTRQRERKTFFFEMASYDSFKIWIKDEAANCIGFDNNYTANHKLNNLTML